MAVPWLPLFTLTHSSPSHDVVLLLTKIKPSIQGTTQNLLLSWNTSIPLCQWQGLLWVFTNGTQLTCTPLSSPNWSNLSLSQNPSLQLPSANLSGQLPPELADLSTLQSLYLSSNSITGSIPLELGYSSSLQDIDFSNNLLNGSVPVSIWNLCDKLVSFRVHSNLLSGSIPRPGLPNASYGNLSVLDLVGHNLFTGNVPEFVLGFSGLKELDLSDNNLSGSIPEGNDVDLCDPPLKRCERAGLRAGVVAGVVISLMTGVVVFASLLIGYFQGKKKKNKFDDDGDGDGDEYEEFEEMEDGENGSGGEGKLVLFQGGEHLTLEDVLNATGQVMEKTSYGTVYKAKLSDGGTIALRLIHEGSCNDLQSCMMVIKQLGRVRHDSLIPLRAFYEGKRGEKLLIYDYLPNRTPHELLHESRPGKLVLNWARRHKIALAIAKGLAHLHTGIEPPITHGNIRSRNVLVDDFFVARLTDFGLYKLMLPSVADEIVALAKTDGYKAPDLQKMKNCNSRTDVYAFGILLLEILLGKKPGKNGGRGGYVDLPSVVKAAVLEETTMEVFDVELLKGIRSPMEEGVVQALKLAMGCCAPVASVRPSMDEVVKQLEEYRPRNRSALYSPTETRSGLVQRRRFNFGNVIENNASGPVPVEQGRG
ncbi:hypothetical protein L1987_29226 [Smallanthus sonchifolius]|uniref:Uncharacterized protein n=1 Tax=Smallanthus sonchifolius TaxID=185202 RepID=A0ACB9I0M6_9ASTR|nr:hypothetical protein L1987_29226 [Smallanthus sonchifolius]